MNMPKARTLKSTAKRAWALRKDKHRRVKVAKFRRKSVVFIAVLLPSVVVVLLCMDYLYRPGAFAIEELQFQGRFEYVAVENVERVVKDSLEGNFFTVDLSRLQQQVQALPWVSAANVRRQWPDKLVIRLLEHQPVMRWGNKGWVSNSGVVIPDDKAVDIGDVTSLIGDLQDVNEMLAHAVYWQRLMVPFNLQLQAVQLKNSHAWKVKFLPRNIEHLDNNLIDKQHVGEITLLLGSEEVQERFNRFLRMYGENPAALMMSRIIDARYPNGLAIIKEAVMGAADNVVNSESAKNTERLSSL